MIDKLEAIKVRFEDVSKLIVDPDVIADMKRYIKLNKEYKDLVKVDLSKPKKEEQDAIQVGETKEVAVGEQTGDSAQVDESVSKSSEVSETQEEKIESDSPLQEITDEEDNTNETGMDRSTETTTASQKQEEIQQEGETQNFLKI